MKTTRPRCPAWLLTCYRISLRVYPAQFRAEYGALMEQAFADRYASFAASGKLSEKVRFAFDTLWDSSQSLCNQHWYTAQSEGFARPRFQLLLLLLVPLIMFHQNLISKASDSFMALDKSLTALGPDAMRKAWTDEITAYQAELAERLRQHNDADSMSAARYVGGQWTTIEDLPEGDALNRMNLRIAHEVIAYPFKPSLFARGDAWYWSDANTVSISIWPINNVKQLRACRKLTDFGVSDPACLQTWEDRRRYQLFSKIMFQPGYKRPNAVEYVAAMEQNRREALELHFIALNNLQHCRIIPAINNVECDKPTAP